MTKIIGLKLKYGQLGLEEIRELLLVTLRGHRTTSAALADVLFDAFQPTAERVQSDDIRWKYWVAMALRYLPALEAVRQALSAMKCDGVTVTVVTTNG